MTNTDPFTDFSLLGARNALLDLSNFDQINLQDDQYLKELQLNNFQTKQLFDELLQEQESPFNISQFQSNQPVNSPSSSAVDPRPLNPTFDKPDSSSKGAQKTEKIFKYKKIRMDDLQQKFADNPRMKEKVRLEVRLKIQRQRFRIQQNDQKQKAIQTIKIKRKNKLKIVDNINQPQKDKLNQAQSEIESESKLFKCEQFQSYLSLS